MSQSIADLLELFDVAPVGAGRFAGAAGVTGADGRNVAKGTRLLGQAVVAVAKCLPDKKIRSAHAVFVQPVEERSGVDLEVDIVHDGRSTATAVVTVAQRGRRCASVTVLADVPSPDVIVHHALRPDVGTPAEANPEQPPLAGCDLRLVDVVDVNSPDEVGPPELYAWVRCAAPRCDGTAKALAAYFTGQLGISTTMRAHRGIGTAQSHESVSTAVLSTFVSFHEPVLWDDWLLYSFESSQAGAGMSFVRGQIHTEDGDLLASFGQEGLIRPLRTADLTIDAPARL